MKICLYAKPWRVYALSRSRRLIHLMLCLSLVSFVSFIFFFIHASIPACAAPQQDYVIGAQDKLRIEVWDNPDLTRDVAVSLTGYFTFPLIGEVRAEGLSTEQVQHEITRMLADGYLNSPQVTVTITEYRSKQVNVLGEVKNPGTYPYTRRTTLIEMISMAGGLTPEAGPDACILRSSGESPGELGSINRRRAPGEDPNSVMKRISLQDLLQTGSELYFIMRENDTIYIPRADFYYVLGEVGKPGQYKLEKDTTVLKAISTAGGHTKKANLKKVSIVRLIGEKEQELPVTLSQPVMPDDIIKVPESFF
jgi:polysaccharide export outer membrane protein